MHLLLRFCGLFAALALIGGAAQAIDTTDRSAGSPDAAEVPIALLVDMRSGQTLYSKEPDRRFMPASITKVMTAFVAFEMIKAGELSERQYITFSKDAASKWRRKGSTMFLDGGDSVPVWMLLRGITAVSANDASIALAEGAGGSVEGWTARMNQTAAELGMSDSHFNTPNGWMDEGMTFTSARDLTTLAREMITRHPALYARYFGKNGLEYNGIAQANHDPITGRVRGADGLKTGFTNEAGFGFLGSAERNGNRLLMVVAGADRARARDKLARDLMEWGFDAFDRDLVFSKGETVAEARVQGGAARTVELVASAPINIAVPAGSNPESSARLQYDGPLRAPIAEGQRVAYLEFEVVGMPTSRIPLYARDAVPEAGFLTRVWNGISGWFL